MIKALVSKVRLREVLPAIWTTIYGAVGENPVEGQTPLRSVTACNSKTNRTIEIERLNNFYFRFCIRAELSNVTVE